MHGCGRRGRFGEVPDWLGVKGSGGVVGLRFWVRGGGVGEGGTERDKGQGATGTYL